MVWKGTIPTQTSSPSAPCGHTQNKIGTLQMTLTEFSYCKILGMTPFERKRMKTHLSSALCLKQQNFLSVPMQRVERRWENIQLGYRRQLERAWEQLGKLVRGQICQRKHWKGPGEWWRVLHIHSKAKQEVSNLWALRFCQVFVFPHPASALGVHYFKIHGAIKAKWNYTALSVKRNSYFTRQCHIILDP